MLQIWLTFRICEENDVQNSVAIPATRRRCVALVRWCQNYSPCSARHSTTSPVSTIAKSFHHWICMLAHLQLQQDNDCPRDAHTTRHPLQDVQQLLWLVQSPMLLMYMYGTTPESFSHPTYNTCCIAPTEARGVELGIRMIFAICTIVCMREYMFVSTPKEDVHYFDMRS